MIRITAFADPPDRGRGLARDMAVRWALEEAGLPYGAHLLTFAELKEPAHRARQPFGQIPTFEHEGLVLFESGAIVLHIAQGCDTLLPSAPTARARAIGWIFAALSTMEPPIVERSMALLLEREQPWFAERQTMLDARVRTRLGDLTEALGERDWLGDSFSAGDLLMISVLRRLGGDGLIEEQQALAAYVARGESRPAFQRAFAAQRAAYEATRDALPAGGPDVR